LRVFLPSTIQTYFLSTLYDQVPKARASKPSVASRPVTQRAAVHVRSAQRRSVLRIARACILLFGRFAFYTSSTPSIANRVLTHNSTTTTKKQFSPSSAGWLDARRFRLTLDLIGSSDSDIRAADASWCVKRGRCSPLPKPVRWSLARRSSTPPARAQALDLACCSPGTRSGHRDGI